MLFQAPLFLKKLNNNYFTPPLHFKLIQSEQGFCLVSVYIIWTDLLFADCSFPCWCFPVLFLCDLGPFCRTITLIFIFTCEFKLWTDVKWTSGWLKLRFDTSLSYLLFETVLDLLRSCLCWRKSCVSLCDFPGDLCICCWDPLTHVSLLLSSCIQPTLLLCYQLYTPLHINLSGTITVNKLLHLGPNGIFPFGVFVTQSSRLLLSPIPMLTGAGKVHLDAF